ncbi:MAG: ABC transporter ATP-binding protein [Hyphomicrobiales bacterium]
MKHEAGVATTAALRGGELLRADGVAVQYGGVRAIKSISLTVEEGRLVLILGPNGAGKTSLLRALAGAVPLRSGRVMLAGHDVSRLPAHLRVKRGVSLVPEGRGRLPGLSVRDNLILGWQAAPAGRRSVFAAELDRIFELFPVLRERMEQDCSTLSGGEMQMLAIARGLLAKPLVLLLDEPSLGLAPRAIARVYAALSKLNASGLAMILVEQKSVPLPAERETTIVLRNGEIRFQEDRRPSASELAALYLGERAAS